MQFTLLDKKVKQQYDQICYKKNLKKIKEQQKKWTNNNLEKVREYRRKHYRKYAEIINEKSRKKYTEDPEKFRQKCKKWKTDNPEEYLESQRKFRQNNSEKIKKWTSDCRRANKLKILTHYSNGTLSCACCGEDTYQFLTLDHINNNGNVDRKKGLTSNKIQVYLIKNNYPLGFQILCYNCNCARAKNKNKICPHKLDV